MSTSELAGKNLTRQKNDENAQSARELASESHVFVCHVLVTWSDNPNRARECDRLESLGDCLSFWILGPDDPA